MPNTFHQAVASLPGVQLTTQQLSPPTESDVHKLNLPLNTDFSTIYFVQLKLNRRVVEMKMKMGVVQLLSTAFSCTKGVMTAEYSWVRMLTDVVPRIFSSRDGFLLICSFDPWMFFFRVFHFHIEFFGVQGVCRARERLCW